MRGREGPKHGYPVVLEAYDRCNAVFESITRNLAYSLKATWDTEKVLEPVDPIHWEEDGSVYVVGRHRGAVYKFARSGSGVVDASVCAPTREAARRTMRFLKRAMPTMEPDQEAVRFEFVRLKASGLVERQQRALVVPEYGVMRSNYGPLTRRALDKLLATRLHDGLSGRIVLWHGPPGTGKTYMLRALAREWKEKARIVYVVDPENFFSGSTDYIMSVLLDAEDERTDRPQWTVIVLEDSGQLFSAAGMAQIDQGLARLLNFSDGVLGQGLRCVFLLTTNERVYRLHPALTRAGRCLANIHFTPFSRADAQQWLARRGIQGGAVGEPVLADLYAIAQDQFPIERSMVGGGSVEVQ